jgi:hypothetical protein
VSSVLLVLFVALVASLIIRVIRRYRRGLVSERGMSIGADLGSLGDAPQVTVTEVSRTAPDRVRVVLSNEDAALGFDVTVALRDSEFGSGQLEEWHQSGERLGIVIPPGSHLIRLRSITSLQHLTLRRVD